MHTSYADSGHNTNDAARGTLLSWTGSPQRLTCPRITGVGDMSQITGTGCHGADRGGRPRCPGSSVQSLGLTDCDPA